MSKKVDRYGIDMIGEEKGLLNKILDIVIWILLGVFVALVWFTIIYYSIVGY